jgi:uncharacterized LabA/DUF88 family protein
MSNKEKKKENNFAFIDGQNLHLSNEYKINYRKFRIYLKDKYKISKAYYFLGFKGDEQNLYKNLQEAGFILVFNERGENMESTKKGNIDTNLVFNCMRSLIENSLDKIILVSGDGDYKPMIDYLIEKNKFINLLTPTNNVSSLYKILRNKYMFNIKLIQNKIEYKQKKPHKD